MDKELEFATVIGEDKKSIVARVSGWMYEYTANVKQSWS